MTKNISQCRLNRYSISIEEGNLLICQHRCCQTDLYFSWRAHFPQALCGWLNKPIAPKIISDCISHANNDFSQ